MKRLLLLSVGSMVALPVYAADYNHFIEPSSLGQNINTLNQHYKLGLIKSNGGYYRNADSTACALLVMADKKDKVTQIKITNNQNCQYKAKSNVVIDSHTTNIRTLLNQVDLKDISFVPGCFNCPSRIEITDNLIINRAEDNYYSEFAIQGYNTEYKNYMAKKLFGHLTEDNYYSMMDMLELRSVKDPTIYDRDEFKLQAVETYNLQGQTWSYTISAK